MAEISRRLADLALSDSGFVFDPYTGATFSVNQSGLTILRALKDGLSRTEIAERLGAEFDVQGADLQRDLDEFVHLLRRAGLAPDGFEG